MIDSSRIRATYQMICVDPVAKALPFSPSGITLVGLFAGLLIPFFLWLEWPLASSCALLFSGYCDTLDGTLARMHRKSSPQGAVLDIVSDRIVEAAVIFGLWLVDPLARAGLCLLMMAAVLVCVTSFLVVGIFTENTSTKSFYYSPGIMERTEAFGLFLLMILMPSFFSVTCICFITLVFLTGFFRVHQFVRCKP